MGCAQRTLIYTEHSVKPGKVAEYKALVGEYYDKLAKDKDFDLKLTGSWEVVVGDIDTFCQFTLQAVLPSS